MSLDAAKAILDAIIGGNGRIVASFTLDEYGRTVGAPVDRRRPYRCSICGEEGHVASLCGDPDMRTKAEKMRDRVREVVDKKLSGGKR